MTATARLGQDHAREQVGSRAQVSSETSVKGQPVAGALAQPLHPTLEHGTSPDQSEQVGGTEATKTRFSETSALALAHSCP